MKLAVKKMAANLNARAIFIICYTVKINETLNSSQSIGGPLLWVWHPGWQLAAAKVLLVVLALGCSA